MSHPCGLILAPARGAGKAASGGGKGEDGVRDGGEFVLSENEAPDPCRLYIMCGPPFAGKSTLARALAARLRLALISIDAINTERGLGIHVAPIAPEEWDGTYAEAFCRLDAA